MQSVFGSGYLYGIPLVDSQGNAISNPSPIQFGTLQDVSVEFSSEEKLLYGQNMYPEDIARGKGKISCKAKMGRINAQLFAATYFGVAVTNGILGAVNDITGKAIPSTPFTITASTAAPSAVTVQIPNSGTWVRDLGVKDQNGLPMTRVASAPATGQYTVAAGVYVFAAADVGLIVYISFEYTAVSTTNKQISIINQPMGYAPSFMAVLSNPYKGKNHHLRLYNCLASKLGLAYKNDDFTIPELDWSCFAQDGTGKIVDWASVE